MGANSRRHLCRPILCELPEDEEGSVMGLSIGSIAYVCLLLINSIASTSAP